ncbi:hypothetical protein [Aquicella lusitana]|uniref:Uncharacterized protein n=1 Tax=Aquicella lusitana TaxID=254246 RepID=A0A370GM95_9COXI|nr:hypothetical protein [Aquicella lusitana]RDI44845.1 hypothetical protein C8D86_10899 [Aquicella lusitana]VVC73042.1 hypothetical protein AQULUS_07700 [Aquicella lusitana]
MISANGIEIARQEVERLQNEINFLERQKEILLVSYNSLKSSNPQKPDEKRKERIEFIKTTLP